MFRPIFLSIYGKIVAVSRTMCVIFCYFCIAKIFKQKCYSLISYTVLFAHAAWVSRLA